MQVIDSAGYLRVVDFGSAKRLPIGKKTNTVSEYSFFILFLILLLLHYIFVVD